MSSFWVDLISLTNSLANLDNEGFYNLSKDQKGSEIVSDIKICYSDKYGLSEHKKTECILNCILSSICKNSTFEMQKCAEKYKKETGNKCQKQLVDMYSCVEGSVKYLNIFSDGY